MKPLTRKQKEARDYVQEYIVTHGRKPTYQQVADHFGIKKTAAFSRCRFFMQKQLPLPNNINMDLLRELLVFSDRYQLTVKFWPDQTRVFIKKDDVSIAEYSGDFDFAIKKSIQYLKRINKIEPLENKTNINQ